MMNEDIGPDTGMALERELAPLDPGQSDPGYWQRFHGWVLSSAAAELARRRLREATIGEVMLAWWRTVVPIAAVAAAIAGFLLMREFAATPVGETAEASMEEMLIEGSDAPVMPSFETADPGGGIVVVNEVY
jgi:hypothetical protein